MALIMRVPGIYNSECSSMVYFLLLNAIYCMIILEKSTSPQGKKYLSVKRNNQGLKYLYIVINSKRKLLLIQKYHK